MTTTEPTDPRSLLTEPVGSHPGGTTDRTTPQRSEERPTLPVAKRIRGGLARVSFWSAALFPMCYAALVLPGTVGTRELLLLGLVTAHVLALVGGRSYLGTVSS